MGNEVYIPDPSWLKTWAQYFRNWATKIDELWLEVDLCNLTPGQLAEATSLLNRFNARKDNLKLAFDYLYKKFIAIAEGLEKLAVVYTNTDDLNKEDAERMREMLNEVGVEPGYILPPNDDYPYYPPPPSEEPDEDQDDEPKQPSKQKKE